MHGIDRIIWAFNGTLYDDVGIEIRAMNSILTRHGYPPIPDAEHYREIFGFPIIDYYRRAGFDFSRHPYEMLAPEWVAEYRRLEPEALLRSDALSAIDALAHVGIAQTLISATEQAMLRRQLDSLRILDRFDGIAGNDNIHAVGKRELVLRWKSEHQSERVVMIGDTEHDFSCARAAGFECILVTGGHRPRRVLEACGCRVFDSLRECAEYVIKRNEQ